MAVKQEFKGDPSDLARAYDKLFDKMEKLERQSRRAAAASRRQSRGIKAAVSGQVAAVGRLAAGYLSVGSAIRIYQQHIENAKQVAEEARQTNLTLADSQAKVLKNIGNVSNSQAISFLESLKEINRESKFGDEKQINLAASSVLSATGGNTEKTLAILKEAAPFFRDQKDALADFSGAMADVMKATQDPNARRTMALMLAIQGQSRFTDLSGFKNVAPALAAGSITGGGGDPLLITRQTAALFAAIGSRSGDVDGSLTKTAIANLGTKLQETVGGDLTPFERLEQLRDMVRQDQAVADRFVSGGFRGPMVPIIRELLESNQSTVSKMVESAFKEMKGSELQVALKQQQLDQLTTALTIRGLEGERQTALETFQGLGNRALMAQAQKTFDEALKQSQLVMGLDQVAGGLERFNFNLPGSEESRVERAISAIQRRQQSIVKTSFLTGETQAQDTTEFLTEQLKTLNKILDAIRENNGEPAAGQVETFSGFGIPTTNQDERD